MFFTEFAILFELDAIRILLLVLDRIIVPLLAFCTG
jgi:hypothetical protein